MLAIGFFSRARFGFLVLWFYQAVSFVMLHLSRKQYLKNKPNKRRESNGNSVNEDNIDKFVELVYKINIYAFIFFGFYLLNGTFERLYRNILPLKLYSFFSCSCENGKI